MEINDLDMYLVELEPAGAQPPVRALLVRLITNSGQEGWGEAAVSWGRSELAARRDALRTTLSGRSIFDIEELHTLQLLATPQLRCAVEMGFWDLIGRTVRLPLCCLLGGMYRRRIPLAVRLTAAPDGSVGSMARELAEQGFHCQIVTSCGQPAVDLEAVRAARGGMGDRAELRFDARSGFDLPTAVELCRELESEEVQFVLDPLAGDGLHVIASLRRQTRVPLAVGQAIAGPADTLASVRASAASFVVVDPGRVGGFVAARKCAAVAEAASLASLLGGEPSLGIGTAAMLHLAAATPAFSGCNECAYPRLHAHVLSEPLEIVDGMIAVPQAPGLGVEVDRTKVEPHLVA